MNELLILGQKDFAEVIIYSSHFCGFTTIISSGGCMTKSVILDLPALHK